MFKCCLPLPVYDSCSVTSISLASLTMTAVRAHVVASKYDFANQLFAVIVGSLFRQNLQILLRDAGEHFLDEDGCREIQNRQEWRLLFPCFRLCSRRISVVRRFYVAHHGTMQKGGQYI